LPLLTIKSISAGKKCGSFYLKCKQAWINNYNYYHNNSNMVTYIYNVKFKHKIQISNNNLCHIKYVACML